MLSHFCIETGESDYWYLIYVAFHKQVIHAQICFVFNNHD